MVTKEKRWIQHNFKTTEAEDAVIRQKMKAFGITNQSSYLRAMALKGYLLKLNLPEIRELIRLMKNLTNNVPEIRELIRLMKNLTNNVNQIARRLNERGSIYLTEIDDIRDRLDRLWETTNQLLVRLETPQK